MSLNCSCPDWDGESGWAFIDPDDFSTLQAHKAKRCKSCKVLIPKGAVCLEFRRLRYPTDFEIDKGIHREDDEIDLALYYHCEKCGDQFFNLSALGFCVDITDNVFNLLNEYRETYGKQDT